MAGGRESDATELAPVPFRPSSMPPTLVETDGPPVLDTPPSVPPPLLAPGETIAGRYRVLGLLGQGGFSEVYKVCDLRDDRRELAMKLLRIGDLHGYALESLKAEFALLASLSHPNLSAVHDFGFADGGVAFFTQSIAEGVRFDKTGVPLASERGVALVAQLCRALDYLHARGILHRDVKPGNVLVDLSNDHVTLLDFGVSRTFGSVEAGVVVGTHAYLAPEAIRGGPVDARADLYALGVTLYRLVTGTLPFRGVDVLAQQLYDAPPPIPESVCPPAVAAVCLRLMRKEPAERFTSAGEACRALANAVGVDVQIETPETLAGYVLSGRFVGREAEVAALAARALAADGAASEPGRAVMVVGADGTGKSRLLREVRQRVQVAGRAWLHAEVARDDAGAGLLADIAAAVITPDLAAVLTNDDRLELSRVLPFLRKRGERVAVPVDPDGARVRRSEALARALALRFAARPGVLAIDGLHRVAPELQHRVAHVVTRLLASHAAPLVLLAGRPGPAMDALAAEIPHDLVQTTALDAPRVARLVASMFGQEGLLDGTALGAALARGRHTPVLVQESLRLAIDDGTIVRRDGRWTLVRDVPALTLTEVLRARVRRLPPAERAVTLALVVLGRAAGGAEVARLVGGPAAQTHDALGMLVASGIVERQDDPRGHSSFVVPERFVDLVLAEEHAPRRQPMHLRAARLLLARDVSGVPDHRALERAAYHLERAGRAVEAARVVMRAATAAEQAGRPDLAASLVGRALRLDPAPERRVARLLARHDHATRAGVPAVVDETLRALSRARSLASPVERLELSLRLAQQDARTGRWQAAGRRARAALRSARTLREGRLECALLLLVAELEMNFGRVEKALDQLLAAARLAEARKERDLSARAWLGVVLAAVQVRRGDLALLAAQKAVRAAKGTNDLGLRSHAERQLGNARLEAGALGAAAKAYRRAVRDARTAGSADEEAKALNNLGTTAQASGDAEEAGAAFRRALVLKDRTGALVSGAVTHNNLGTLLAALGDHGRAEEELRRALDAAARPSPRAIASVHENLGDLRLVQGRFADAIEEYRASIAVAHEHGSSWQVAHATTGLLRALVACGDLRGAREARDGSDEILGTLDHPEARRRFLVADAILLDAEGRPRDARRAARKAVALGGSQVQFWGLLGSPLEARWVLAVVQARAGDAAGALEAARSARAVLDRSLARLPTDEARDLWMRAHPLHLSVARGTLDTGRRSWPPMPPVRGGA